MKFLPSRPLALAAVSLVLTSSAVLAQSPDALAAQLVDGLKKANLTAIADLASTHGGALLPVLFNAGSKTLLAPSNEAVFKVQAKLSGATPAQIDAILKYHIVNGTISYASLPTAFDYHIVAPTFLNDSIFTNLPDGQDQVVVISRSDSRDPIEVDFGYGKTHFAGTQDGPTIGSLTIQVIDDVMIPPANFSLLSSSSQTQGQDHQDSTSDLSEFRSSLDKMNLTSSLTSSKGLTILAPINDAFKAVQSQLLQTNKSEFTNIFRNHIINGTVVYSVQLPSNAGDNDNATTGKKITELHTATGQMVHFAFSSSTGHLQVSCGNVTANVVKTDKITNNGVVHYLDQILLNTLLNSTLAADIAPQQSQKSTTIPNLAAQSANAAASATQDANSHKSSASNQATSSTALVIIMSAATAYFAFF